MKALERASTRTRLALLGSCAALAFLLPLWQLLIDIDQLQPDGIRIFVPFLAFGWLYLRLRGQQIDAAAVTSAISLGIGCTVVLVLLYLLPAFTMRFWQWHWLVLPVFCAGTICMLFGRAALRTALPVLLYLLFLWPPLIHLISQVMTAPLLAISEGGTFLLIDVFNLPVHVSAEHQLTCQTPHGSAQLRIAAPCSGINGFLALLLCLIPLIYEARASIIDNVLVCCAGLALLGLLSILRLTILTWVTCAYGLDQMFDWFHWLSGPLFFLILCCSVFFISALLGLRLRLADTSRVQGRPLHSQLCLYYLGFAIISGVCTGLIANKPLIPKPPAITHHYDLTQHGHLIPQLPGSESWYVRNMDWTSNLFGADSRFERFACLRGQRIFWIDSLLTRNFHKIELHNVFDCYRWHNYQLLEQHFHIHLGKLPARSYRYRDDNMREWLSMTWIESIQHQDQTWWQRFHVQVEVTDATALRNGLREDLRGICEELLEMRQGMVERGEFGGVVE